MKPLSELKYTIQGVGDLLSVQDALRTAVDYLSGMAELPLLSTRQRDELRGVAHQLDYRKGHIDTIINERRKEEQATSCKKLEAK